MGRSAGASSTSPRRPSRPSPPSGPASSTSGSSGSDTAEPPGGLGRSAVRELAARHGIRPSRSLGQNFLTDPNLARAIAADAAVGSGDRVLEVGAGLGSLTVALAATGAEVTAVEFDRALLPALEEVCAGLANVRVVHADALRTDWPAILPAGRVTMVSNLPYNIAVPLLLSMFEDAPSVVRFVVMVQREVGERLAASAGEDAYGAVSAKVAYYAERRLLRRVPATVFWPAPSVESVVVELTRRPEPPVDVDLAALFAVIEAGFAERRKRMTNALRRLGLDAAGAEAAMTDAGLDANVRAEEIDLEGFARLASALIVAGALEPSP